MSFPASFFYSKCTFPSSVSREYETKVPSGFFDSGFGFVAGPCRSDEGFAGRGGGNSDEDSVGGGGGGDRECGLMDVFGNTVNVFQEFGLATTSTTTTTNTTPPPQPPPPTTQFYCMPLPPLPRQFYCFPSSSSYCSITISKTI